MNFLKWLKNLPTSIRNLIGFVTTLVAFIVLIRTNLHVGISVTVLVLWLLLVWGLLTIVLSKNNAERRGLVPQPGKAVYKYSRWHPWGIAGLFLAGVMMVALIWYAPTRNVAKYALLGTPTSSPAPTATATITATPGPPDLTMLVTTPNGDDFCWVIDEYVYMRERSVIDIAVNNNSDRVVLFTSVALLPQKIEADPFVAGRLDVTETYSVSVADWLNWTGDLWLGEKPATPHLEPVYVEAITADKYSLQPHTAERFQIIVGVDLNELRGTDYLLYGSVRLEISLDNGDTIRSEPVELMLCGTKTFEEISNVDATFYEGVYALRQGDIERAIARMHQAAAQDLGDNENDPAFAELCERGTQRGYADEVLFACDQIVQTEPNDAGYRVTRGIARTIAGDFTGAIEDFEFSVAQDVVGGVDEESLQQRQGWITELNSGQNPFSGEATLYKGVHALYADNLGEAIEYFHQALEIGFELREDVSYWQRLCQDGSIKQVAGQVLFACDHAVELAPQDGDVHDSRGIARALAGEYTGAIEDFEFAVTDWAGSVTYEEDITLRKAWILELQEDKNPITEEFLSGSQLR